MLKNQIVLAFLLVLPVITTAQADYNLRKGHLFLDLGTEYRITPIYEYQPVGLTQGDFSSFVSRDMQNAGLAINIGLEYFIIQNLSIGFINAFRYDIVVSETTDLNADFGVQASTNGLLIDYHLMLRYYISLSDTKNLSIGAGVSRLNTNTSFTGKRSFFDPDGNLIASVFEIRDFAYWANRLELGYHSNRTSANLGIYISRSTPYFQETTTFIIPFLGVKYRLGKF